LVPQGQQKIPVFKEIIKNLVHPYMQPPAIKENFITNLRYGVEGKYAWERRFKWPESDPLTA